MPYQFGDIFRPLGEGRNADREYVQPIEQILAEAAHFYIGNEVAVGGGDDPHVNLHRLARANRLDLVVLDRAQQLHLRGGRKLANLVEEQRAAGRFHELAGVPVGCAGEGALLVAEQHRLDEIVRDGAAIDRHEWLGAPLAGAMDGARGQLLADTRLACDEYRDRRVRRLFGGAQHRVHAWAARDDVANKSVPERLRLRRDSSPASALVASALRSDTCSRSAPTGLTTKSAAPARMAPTTLSMPPCAVCTMTGMASEASRILASTPSPSRSGITRSSTTASMRAPSAPVSSTAAASPPSATITS